jgi:prepilin-type N-terminal cleavage/methylation domain-containing protein
MSRIAQSGFSLLEMMIVITILGIVATVAVPLLGSNDTQKLKVAAEETANTLRFALSEAKRTNDYVLIDGKNLAGHLKLYYSTSNGNLVAAIADPLTKRPADLYVSNAAFSQNVVLTPQFSAGGAPRLQLLIGPNASQMWGFDGVGGNTGILVANSGVLLTLGSQSILVRINEVTGLVTLQ